MNPARLAMVATFAWIAVPPFTFTLFIALSPTVPWWTVLAFLAAHVPFIVRNPFLPRWLRLQAEDAKETAHLRVLVDDAIARCLDGEQPEGR